LFSVSWVFHIDNYVGKKYDDGFDGVGGCGDVAGGCCM
jgi:hypothetical protein